METNLRVVKEDGGYVTLYYALESTKPISYDVTDGVIPIEVLKRIAYIINQGGIVTFEGLEM